MKRLGYRPAFSGAVEAVASTGGQIMPPIMGAAAFLMAEFTGVPYIQIVKHAVIPAILYYLGVFMAVHFEALRDDLQPMRREQLPRLGQVLRQYGHLLTPVAAIVIVLVLGYTPMRAAVYALALSIVSSWLRRDTRMGLKGIVEALEAGGKAVVVVATACATAGIIIGIVTFTGVGLKFSSLLLSISGGTLLGALLITMIAGIVLGMGLSTTAAYVIQAAILAPALVKLGLPVIAAHFFVFYWAILSAITPPVAIGSYAAAGLAQSDPTRTSFIAVRMALPAFLVPYFFVYGPSLLFIGEWTDVLLAAFTGSIGVCALAAATSGWLIRETPWYQRLTLGAGALLLMHPGAYTDGIGLVIVILAALLNWRWPRTVSLSTSKGVSG